MKRFVVGLGLVIAVSWSPARCCVGQDWRQFGGSPSRNNAPFGMGVLTEWDAGKFDRDAQKWIGGKNIKWRARLGSQTYGTPVVAHGRIFIGTNNDAGYLKGRPKSVDLSCLLCFREADGQFLWQHSNDKLATGRVHDWPRQGICSTPLVEGDRLWYVNNRGQVVCLDTVGHYDDEDDGPNVGRPERMFVGEPKLSAGLNDGVVSADLRASFQAADFALPKMVRVETTEPDKQWLVQAKLDGRQRSFFVRLDQRTEIQWHRAADGELTRTKVIRPFLEVQVEITTADKHYADVIWQYDMMKSLGVSQHNMSNCSVTSWGDALFVCTSNGVDESHFNIPAADAPSFIALDKRTGKLLWKDNSPGKNILHGQWSSPAVGVFDDVPQVIFGGGDGWLYSFRADRWKDERPELLWKFDCNPKDSKWTLNGRGTRNNIIGMPMIYDGRLYISVGQDPEHLSGNGHIWCVDPARRGDVSPHLVVSKDDPTNVIPHKRMQAAVVEDGDVIVPNPNSAVVWHYTGSDVNGDGKRQFEEEMHRSIGTLAAKDGLLVAADFAGIFHLLDAKTGKAHWTSDCFASVWCSPLIVEDNIYVGDEDGDVAIFKLSPDATLSTKLEVTKKGDLIREPKHQMEMPNSIQGTPVYANRVLYIATKNQLFAIAPE